MLFRTVNDWKQLLNVDDEERLNEVLRRVSRHRGAYKNSDEIKIAQLWCAVLELAKQNFILQKRVNLIDDVFMAIYEKHKKRELEEIALLKSLDKF